MISFNSLINIYIHCMAIIIVYLIIPAAVVVLSGTSQNADFAGFLIQGRMVADNTTRVGTFIANGGDQQTACSSVSVIIFSNISCITVLYSYCITNSECS